MLLQDMGDVKNDILPEKLKNRYRHIFCIKKIKLIFSEFRKLCTVITFIKNINKHIFDIKKYINKILIINSSILFI